jgi:hypothetical protein
MRTKIAAGKALPVAELAKAWGLGRMKPSASDRLLDVEYLQRDFQQPGSIWEQSHPHQPQDRLDPNSGDSVQTEMLYRQV